MHRGPSCVAPLAAFVVAIVVGSACANETIVLATIPDNDAGAPAPPARCVDSTTCPPGYYCSMATCGDTSGTCVLPPVTCDGVPQGLACGCDNVTYFNDCLRQENGVRASRGGECLQNPTLCGGKTPCPGSSVCAQLSVLPHDECHQPGRCWVVPPKCPTGSSTDLWEACGSSGALCLDTCAAILAGGAYRRSNTCKP